MRWHPLRKVGVDGDQFDAEADAYQKAKQNNHLRALLKGHQQRKNAIPRQRAHKGQASAKAVGIRREQAGADKQAEKGGGGEGSLIGDAEHARAAGVEDAGGQQPGADIAGLKQIVEFEEAAEREQRNKTPQSAR